MLCMSIILTLVSETTHTYREYQSSMCVYYLCIGEWNECSCTGERPPPCEQFSLNQLDKQRAILFGGKQNKYTIAFNEVYILTAAEEGKEMVNPLAISISLHCVLLIAF